MYAIVQSKENGAKQIFRCPMNWIVQNVLKWPTLQGTSLVKAIKCNAEPLENWKNYSEFKILYSNICKSMY